MITKHDIKAECNKTGAIYYTDYEMIDEYYQDGDFEEGLEVAVALLQAILTGGHQYSDQKFVKKELRSRCASAEKSFNHLRSRVETSNKKDIEDNELAEIASMWLEGAPYQVIADSLKKPVSKSTVHRRLVKIANSYPWLIDNKTVDDVEEAFRSVTVTERNERNTSGTFRSVPPVPHKVKVKVEDKAEAEAEAKAKAEAEAKEEVDSVPTERGVTPDGGNAGSAGATPATAPVAPPMTLDEANRKYDELRKSGASVDELKAFCAKYVTPYI